jgi:RNA 3'-terminal phosphate cyclase
VNLILVLISAEFNRWEEKTAEHVGEEAAYRFLESNLANVPIDVFLADMMVLPLRLAKGKSRYRI